MVGFSLLAAQKQGFRNRRGEQTCKSGCRGDADARFAGYGGYMARNTASLPFHILSDL